VSSAGWRIHEIPDCASSPKAYEESAMDLGEGATKRLANELSKAGVGVTVRVSDPFSIAVRSIPALP
jgi:hypothetical protein